MSYRLSCRQPQKHLQFTLRQFLMRRFLQPPATGQRLCQLFGNTGADVLASTRHSAYGINNVFGVAVFAQIATGTLLQQCRGVMRFGQGTQDQHRQVRGARLDGDQCFNSTLVAHGEVHHHDIDTTRACDVQRFAAIGGFADEASARQFESDGWVVQEDAGRGWRRVIASPIPRRIVELDAIRSLVDMGYVVVSVGGGGIPVFENQKGELRGCVGAMGAVIDKDRASGLLAAELGVDLFLISTGVEKVAINFNKPNQQWLDRLTLAEAKRYYAEGHFLKGSMLSLIHI